MSVAAGMHAQEKGRFDAMRSDRGSVSYLLYNARPMANTLPTATRSRGTANTGPGFTIYGDTQSARTVPAAAPRNERRAVAAYAAPAELRSSNAVFRAVPDEPEALSHIPRQDDEMAPVKTIAFLTAAITAMLPIGGVLIGVVYSNLRSDIDDVKKSSNEMVKTIASVDKQAAVTNQKLEDILRELQKPRR
jgi:hypothetical protein